MSSAGTTDGERWTRHQLAALGDESFRPRALAAFVVESQRRASQTRRARPDLARREQRWAATGAVAWLALAAVGLEPFRRRLRSGLAGWAATVLMLDWHLGMVETERGRRCNLGPADAATLMRAWLVPAVAAGPSPVLCVLGFVTDAIDGPLARATQPTRLGRDLERVVDAAFAGAAVVAARRNGAVGPLATAGELTLLAAGVGYGVGAYFVGARPPDPTILGAARASAPLRAGGIVAASLGHRRTASGLLAAGSTAGLVAVVRAARSRSAAS